MAVVADPCSFYMMVSQVQPQEETGDAPGNTVRLTGLKNRKHCVTCRATWGSTSAGQEEKGAGAGESLGHGLYWSF